MSADMLRVVIGLLASVGMLVLWPLFTRLSAFFSLLMASFMFSLIVGLPVSNIIPIMQNGFGSLLEQIGLVVALGSVLGMVLEKTGAMQVISTSILGLFGSKRPVLAMTLIGGLVGIPVFCDSGFIILSRLIPSLSAATSANQGALVLALSSGLYTTHTMVPPTPGPLAAAATLGLGNQLGLVIAVGLVSSVPVCAMTYWYANRFGQKIAFDLTTSTIHDERATITPIRAFLPLLLPIFLIASASFLKASPDSNMIFNVLSVLGLPLVALLIGVGLSLTLIHRDQIEWPAWISEALKDAGVIILITGAGGAFGAVIKASALASLISVYSADSLVRGVLFLVFAWLIAAILKTAQGSSTSSMIITSSLMLPLIGAAGFSSAVHLAILVVAIGGGSIAVSHANDSYFWVVSQFGSVKSGEAFRVFTPMTLIQGVTALLMSILLFLLL